MHTVGWLPPEPLTIERALEYERSFEHIEMCAPMLGVLPEAKETVVLCYVGIHDQTIYTVFDPELPAWIVIESGPTDTVVPQTGRILEQAMAFIEAAYPDDQFALLKRMSNSM